MATYKAPEVTMTLVAFEARLVEAGWTKKDGEYSHPKFADKRISFLPRPFAQHLHSHLLQGAEALRQRWSYYLYCGDSYPRQYAPL